MLFGPLLCIIIGLRYMVNNFGVTDGFHLLPHGSTYDYHELPLFLISLVMLMALNLGYIRVWIGPL